jgi:hypothetical protein
LAADLERKYALVERLLDEALVSKRTARGWCPSCKKAVYVEIPNTALALKAAEFFANQGLGRPAEDRRVVTPDFVVERVVVEPGAVEPAEGEPAEGEPAEGPDGGSG